jgi:hypothetical protein
LESGLPGFPQGFSGLVVLGNLVKEVRADFAYGTVTLYGSLFQSVSAIGRIDNFLKDLPIPPTKPHNPGRSTPAGYHE